MINYIGSATIYFLIQESNSRFSKGVQGIGRSHEERTCVSKLQTQTF
ncbi:MAG: hypothetical protein ACJAZ2_000824 [Glaciecola sp.]|jgi:hypothetical protein